MVDDRGNYFAPCGWMKKEMSPFELVDGCKACAQRYHYRVRVPVTAGPRPMPPDPHGPVANAVALGAVAALAPPGSGVVARNTVGDRAVGQGAPSSGPRGDELGRAPPEVRVRWVGPPSAGLHPAVTPPCLYLPTLETVRSPPGQQTLGAPCALPRGEGSRGDEVVSPGARNTVGARAVGQGAPSSCPCGEELGRAPPDVRPLWWGPPESDIHFELTPPCNYPPPLRTVRSPRGQQTFGAPRAVTRGEGNWGDEGQGRRGHDWDSEYGRAQ